MGTLELVVAVAALLAATAAVLLGVRRLLADADGTGSPPRLLGSRGLAALGVVAVAAVAVAVGIDRHDASASSVEGSGTAAASRTLRDFLVTAVVDRGTYDACEYLTVAERQSVAQRGGGGQTCQQAVTFSPLVLPGVSSQHDVDALRLRPVMQGDTVRITASGPRTPARSFVLRRATAAELSAFEAPPAAWRIAAGVTGLMG